jgi:serine protease AprX
LLVSTRSLAAALCLVVLATLAPASAGESHRAWIDPYVLGTRGSTSAFIHVESRGELDRVITAAQTLGLGIGTIYDEVDVFLAYGPEPLFHLIAKNPAVEAIEGNHPLSYFTDSSHSATGSQALLDGDVTLPDGTRIDGAGIGVAIVDSGIEGTHPDLVDRVVSNVKLVCPTHPTSVYVQPLTKPDECLAPAKTAIPMDDTDTPSAGGHGTHVSGIVAGTGAASGGRWHGAAPGASLYGVSIGTAVTVENAADGLRWVLDNHDQPEGQPDIRVVNDSWGTSTHARYDTAPDSFQSVVWRLQEQLVAAGVVVVQAAGNTGGDGSAATTTPECVNPTPGVICVANYYDGDTGSRSGNIDGSSSRGQRDPSFIDTWPDLSAPGTNIVSTCRDTLPVCAALGTPIEDPDNSYAAMTGTSMAAPHVAGIVAQVLQVDPTLTPAAVEELLEDTAYKFTWGTRYALVDPTNPDDSTSFEKGHGLVDALAAVKTILLPDEPPTPDPTWPPDEPPPVLGDPGPSQRFFFHSTARANQLDKAAGTNGFSATEPSVGSGAAAQVVWASNAFAGGTDPSWSGSVEGPLQSLMVDFWVKSTDESTESVGVPPIFHVVLKVGDETYRLPAFSPSLPEPDTVPRRLTRSFSHYLVPDGPDEDGAEDLEWLNIDTTGKPVTVSIGADWFHHAGAIVYDSTQFPSGFSANYAAPAACAPGEDGSASSARLYFHSTTRVGNVDAAIGQTTLAPSAPTSGEDALIEDAVVIRNPIPQTAFDPIWRGGALDGDICSLTIDFWQKQALDELILQTTNYNVRLWVGDESYDLPSLVAPGSTADATRITHTFTSMLDGYGNEVPLRVNAADGPVAIEIAGRYLDADLQTTIFYDSITHPSSLVINGAE